VDRDKLLNVIQECCPRLIELLRVAGEQTIGEYAKALWKTPPRPASTQGKLAWQYLVSSLNDHLRKSVTAPPGYIEEALNQFEQYPILQTADHCGLLLDPTSFHTNLLYHIGARKAGQRFLFINAASTITFETWRAEGPGWLNINGVRINVFGLSRRDLTGKSVSAATGSFKFKLSIKENESSLTEPEKAYVNELRDLLGKRLYVNAADAFDDANRLLWEQWDSQRRTSLVITDDRFTSTVLALHLKDERSVISRMLFDSAVRRGLKRELGNVSNRFFPNSTDHFWGVRDGRIRPLRLKEGVLRDETDSLRIPFERETLIEGLRQGRLYPNLFFAFLVLSIVPRVRVLGGHRQLTYLPLITQIFDSVLSEFFVGECDDLRRDLRQGQIDGMIANVISNESHPISLVAGKPRGMQLDHLSREWEKVKVKDAFRDLKRFEFLQSLSVA
jgi:hypothetical protein